MPKSNKKAKTVKPSGPQIGSFGSSLIFTTSSKKILTFNNFTQKVTGIWSEHDVIGRKARAEFNGPGLREISFEITLDVNLGVKPRAMLETIEKMIEKGKVEKLIIGSKKVGNYRWRITSMSERWDYIYNGGQLARATGSITIKEYV